MSGALHVLEHHALVYRRTWKGSMFVSFASPVLFLAAMGVGLGSLISSGPARTIGGVSYLGFLAPALLAATAMQTAFVETTYPIMARLQWLRTYDGMLATPLSVQDLVAGEIGWLLIRLASGAAAFFLVMLVFGAVHSLSALLIIPVALLTGLAFGGPIMAFTATQTKDQHFPTIQRFIITPLFLLGGVFFPIQQLPVLVQGLAWLTPLAHSVVLARGLAMGSLPASAPIDIIVLLAYATAGMVAATIAFPRRLLR